MLFYDEKLNGEQGWLISETRFDQENLGKTEAIFTLSNGYMGIRSANEETYATTVRGHFVAGTFNSFGDEVCELPNMPDVTRMNVWIDGERVQLHQKNHKHYKKTFNLKTLEVTRSYTYITADDKEVDFVFKRFLSYDNNHLFATQLEVVAHQSVKIVIEPCIDGRITNTGSQHFAEGEKRIHGKNTIEYLAMTTQSEIDFIICASHKLVTEAAVREAMHIDRRLASLQYALELEAGDRVSLTKTVLVRTTRDLEYERVADFSAYRKATLAEMDKLAALSYDELLGLHKQKVAERIWDKFHFKLESEQPYDLLAMRFAHYHLIGMMPVHDNRMGIAAKALSGEGYKGHSFWDTEIFVLPFFTFTDPQLARRLLEYRYQGLAGARKKAKENNYRGAMYPWEAAWPTDGEVTPVWGAVDVVTGKQTKIWSGFIEQHISADVVYGVWQYYRMTHDDDFMLKCGYEMIFDVANFWASRLEWNEAKRQYDINDVIGPDEYKEHVDNNAFTNYMAYFSLTLAEKLYRGLEQENPSFIAQLASKIELDGQVQVWQERSQKLFLPQPNEQLVIAQDDTYLSKQLFDLAPYKRMDQVGMLFRDYSLDQVNEMQVTKQADVVILMYLLEDLFDSEIKRANYEYYEPKTTHDSSLSLSTHTIIANDLQDYGLAYELFERACRIDLGPNMKSSDHGIHAASIAGMWQSTVFGFAGVRLRGHALHIAPNLPKQWQRLEFDLVFRGEKIHLECLKEYVIVTPLSGNDITVTVYGKSTTISESTKFTKE